VVEHCGRRAEELGEGGADADGGAADEEGGRERFQDVRGLGS
jgi:hypothetical protein